MEIKNIFMKLGLSFFLASFAISTAEAKNNKLALKLSEASSTNEQKSNSISEFFSDQARSTCSQWDPRCAAKPHIEEK